MAHPIATQASTLDYDTFAKEVGGLFERPNNPVRAEYDFRSRKQGATEMVTDYLTALRTLHIDCERPEQESHDLTMQLALGCYNQRTQEKLLTETVVDLDCFVQIMQATRQLRRPPRSFDTTLRLLLLPIHHVRRANLLTSAALDVGHHLEQYISRA